MGRYLRDLRPAAATYCRTEATQPWGIGMQFQEGVRFHFVAEGRCWVLVEGTAPERLEEGDVVLLPHGTKHVVADDPATVATDLAEIGPEAVSPTSFRLAAGGGGARCLLLCCTVAFEEPLAQRLIASMPKCLIVRGGSGQTRGLKLLLDVMAEEMAADSLGSATVMARLADAGISMIVRDWAERAHADMIGWRAAMREPGLARALLGIHGRPGERWPLGRLAETAGMSRSTFAERFTRILGIPAARYVAEWRMVQARRLLAERRLSIADVAMKVGYTSEAAFSRAYKRLTGQPPSSARSRQ